MSAKGWWALIPAVVLSMLPGGSHAQQSDGGRLEFGALVDYARFDPERLNVQNDLGLGLRLGYFVTRHLSVEALASRVATQDGAFRDVDVTELGGSVLASFRLGGTNRVYLGAGYSRLQYSGATDFTDQAAHLSVGDRIPLSRLAALRIEGRASYATSSRAPGPAEGPALSFRTSVGLSVFVGERPPRDSDTDLIPDEADRCPQTPPGLAVDGSGCPRDTDADGVFDGVDRCRATPSDVEVDVRGCALDGDEDLVPDYRDRCPTSGTAGRVDGGGCPLDDDGDGIPNDSDLCPRSPRGSRVSASGCPVDEDRDGVPDDEDRCLGTPIAREVDELGCPVLFEERGGEQAPLILLGVTFEVGEAVLTPGSFSVLDQVAASLLAYPAVRVEVAGHTDDQGSTEFNRELSLRRAEAVRDYLTSQGIATNRLEVVGFGSSQPVASNETEVGRAQNRRVVLRRIEG